MKPYFHNWFIYSVWATQLPCGNRDRKECCNGRDPSSIPGSGRPPGEGNGNPPQYLAWKISWTEELGRLQSMGLQRVAND